MIVTKLASKLPRPIRNWINSLLNFPLGRKLFYLVKAFDGFIGRTFFHRDGKTEFKFGDRVLVGNIRFYKSDHTDAVYGPIARILKNTQFSSTDVLLDVGANIGLTAITMADQTIDQNCKIIAFEPGDQIHMARENLKRAGYEERVQIEEIALFNAETELTLFTHGESIVDSRIFEDREWRDFGREKIYEKKVRATKLDTYLRTNRIPLSSIKLVKIDCQGAEPFILDGFFASEMPPSDLSLIMEFWPYSLSQQGVDIPGHLKNLWNKFDGWNFYAVTNHGEQWAIESCEEFLGMGERVGVGMNKFCDIIVTPMKMEQVVEA